MMTKNVTAGQLIWGKTELDTLSFDTIIAADWYDTNSFIFLRI